MSPETALMITVQVVALCAYVWLKVSTHRLRQAIAAAEPHLVNDADGSFTERAFSLGAANAVRWGAMDNLPVSIIVVQAAEGDEAAGAALAAIPGFMRSYERVYTTGERERTMLLWNTDAAGAERALRRIVGAATGSIEGAPVAQISGAVAVSELQGAGAQRRRLGRRRRAGRRGGVEARVRELQQSARAQLSPIEIGARAAGEIGTEQASGDERGAA